MLLACGEIVLHSFKELSHVICNQGKEYRCDDRMDENHMYLFPPYLAMLAISRLFLLMAVVPCLISCYAPHQNVEGSLTSEETDTHIYTAYSSSQHLYKGFESSQAINRIAQIQNKYFQQYELGLSEYYGTAWREYAEPQDSLKQEESLFTKFRMDLGTTGDSMHCTIYAVEALKYGMGEAFEELEQSHQRIWKKREHAGWSIGYLLVKEWNWKAYLILDKNSKEFDHCQRAYRRKKEYPVWRQPNIPLEDMLIRGKDDSLIQSLLHDNEFGWGFSHQGIHTWITRYDQLKECNWLGAPGKRYEIWPTPLFLKTPFLQYKDYASHVLIFPPKNI